MRTRQGKIIETKTKADGSQVMVGRIVFLEPALWDQYDRLAEMAHKTRSTYIRCELKDHRRSKMAGVDWYESNVK
jgi:hypothetical protein